MKLVNLAIKELENNKAEDVIVNYAEEEHMQLKFFNNKISPITKWKNKGLGIFCVINKRIVSTTVNELSESGIRKTVKKIVSFAKEIDPSEEYAGIAAGPFKYRQLKLYDPKLAELNEEAIAIIKTGISTANLKQEMRCSGVLEVSNTSSILKTNHDVEAESKSTAAYYSLRALYEKNASGHMVSCARSLKNLDYEYASSEAARIGKEAANPKQGASGTYDVLFYPLAAANILEQAGSSTSIFNVESGLSCYAGLLNKPVANKTLDLFDDGNIPEGLGTSQFDAEGVPTQNTPLIESGILKNYLHNTSTAKRHKTTTTANAGLISPSPHNLVVTPGTSTREELIKSMKKGLIMTNLWYTRFQNYSTGDFSTIPRDGIFLVENGMIRQPIHSIRISENLINIMKNVSSIGCNTRQIHGWEVETPTFTPDILIKNVKITKPI